MFLNKKNIEIFIPKTGQTTNVYQWHIKLLEILQKEMIDNFHKLKLIILNVIIIFFIQN